MGKIVLVVTEQGNLQIQSDFNHAMTALILAKAQAAVVAQPFEVQSAIVPATLAPRINGLQR